jgi:hypothetical protein
VENLLGAGERRGAVATMALGRLDGASLVVVGLVGESFVVVPLVAIVASGLG